MARSLMKSSEAGPRPGAGGSPLEWCDVLEAEYEALSGVKPFEHGPFDDVNYPGDYRFERPANPPETVQMRRILPSTNPYRSVSESRPSGFSVRASYRSCRQSRHRTATSRR